MVPKFLCRIKNQGRIIVVKFIDNNNQKTEKIQIFPHFISFQKNQENQVSAITILAALQLFIWQNINIEQSNGTQLECSSDSIEFAAMNIYESFKE